MTDNTTKRLRQLSLLLLLESVPAAVSNRQSSGVGEACRPSEVVGKPPELDVEWGIACPDLAALFFVEGAGLENMRRGLFTQSHIRTLLCMRIPSHTAPPFFLLLFFFRKKCFVRRREIVICSLASIC